jgi:hypothetical protein
VVAESEGREDTPEPGDDEFAISFDEDFVRSAPVREPDWRERAREAERLRRQQRKEQRMFKRRRRANRFGGRFGGWSDSKGLIILVALVVAGFIFAGLEGRGPLGFLRSEPSRTPPAVSTTTAPAVPGTGESPTTEAPAGAPDSGGTSVAPAPERTVGQP